MKIPNIRDMRFNIIKHISLNFPKTAFAYRYMQHDWKNVKTLEEALEFYHKWHNDMLTSVNPVRIKAIKSIVYPLYAMLTGTSFESKIAV